LLFHVAALTFWLYRIGFSPEAASMISVTHFTNTKEAKDYHAHLSRDDYFGKDAREMPVYEGRTAERLGIKGMEATKDSFYALCENRHPVTGERLTSRTRDDRRIMTDVTFDVGKSVTLAALYDKRIDGLVDISIRETMNDIESEMAVRVRKGGKDTDRKSGNIIYVVWQHETTRPLEDGTVDPQKHRHVTVLNVSHDPKENILKACQWGDIVRDKAWYQSAFHARLASKLKAVGYGIEKEGSGFRIAGISKDTTAKFSRRTAVIEAEAERLGITDAAAKADLGRKTREKKSKEPQSMAELRREWDSRLTPEERLAIQTAARGLAKGDNAITPEQAKAYALEHSFERASAVSEPKLKAEALMHGVGSVLPEDVADLAQHPEAIPVEHEGQLMLTTKTVLNNEVAFLQFAKDGQRKFKPFVSISELNVNKPGEFVSLNGLSAEQKKAAVHILTSRDAICAVSGKAGTGKTTMMRATRDAIESVQGQHVFAFAPSSQASRNVLAKEGFKDAETLEMLLKNEKLQERTRGQVIWIDEAGLVSSNDMSRVAALAKRNGNRLILSGDYAQHNSVSAGDAFRLLEKEGGVKFAKLTQIRRQTTPGYKKAVEAIAEGTGKSAQKGFDALDRMGNVIEASGNERHGMLVADYLNARDEGRTALIVVPTHAEAGKVTDELRTVLKQRGALGEERQFIARKSTGWTDAQKGDVRNYEPGMVLEFHQNAKGFKRGEKVVVLEHARALKAVPKLGRRQNNDALVGGESDELVALRQDGSRVSLPLGQAQRFDVFRSREIAIARGDRIRITKNGEAKVEGQAKGTRLNNGDIFTVEGFTKDGDIRLENGRLLPKNWGHLSLGYTDTSYAAQGKTSDRVFISVGDESLPAVNRQGWYVAASRGREQAKIYVDSKEDVRNAIARTGERLSAVELTKTKLRPSWRSRFYESLERNRVGRFLKARAAAIADRWRGPEYGHA
jgi:conjugative relaxase-like TrwC/TraI family protein